ncbi:hypothetical protein DPMN_175003 [Dreissena polymorpha]|uniref:Uncharacterized protein n=1 Tax=Dreissena polymorpha TaxID=45954 RepID=A0A9D4E4E8_DREPO|nr:hypothetical protein DPMN_175003 [Dreissena polymorpha]
MEGDGDSGVGRGGKFGWSPLWLGHVGKESPRTGREVHKLLDNDKEEEAKNEQIGSILTERRPISFYTVNKGPWFQPWSSLSIKIEGCFYRSRLGRQERINMMWGDLEMGNLADGTRYVSYMEGATNTRKGINTDHRMFKPKIFEEPVLV